MVERKEYLDQLRAWKDDKWKNLILLENRTAEETFEREMRPLRSIHDNYEKIVLTLDRFSIGNYDGIKVINVIDWLLE